MYRQSEKNLLSSNISPTCPRNMVNFGPLAAKILLLVWGTPDNFNGFRVLAALQHGILVMGVSQTAALNRGRHLYSAGRPWRCKHNAPSALSSGSPFSQGNAEALDRWGGKTKHRQIPYCLSNTSAKNYHNQIVYVKIIASQLPKIIITRNVGQCPTWWSPCRT